MYLNSSVNVFNASNGPKDLFLNDGITSFLKRTIPNKIKKKKDLTL